MIYTDTVQTVEHLGGTLAYKIRRSATPASTPTFASLRLVSPVVERIDVIAGDYEIPEAEFEFYDEDDSSRYWLSVLAGETLEVILELTEGATTSTLFWGEYVRGSATLSEYDHSTMQRMGSFRCISVLRKLKDVDSQTVFDACYYGGDMIALTEYNGLGTAARIMNVKRFLARIMEQMNGSLDDTDIVTTDLAQDVQYSLDGSTWYDWFDLYFWSGSQNYPTLSHGWFESTEWLAKFPSAFEMLVGVLRGVFAVPVYYYDYANSRHRIRVMTRGHAMAAAASPTMGKCYESTIYPDVSHGIRVIGVRSGWSAYATNPSGQVFHHVDSGLVSADEPSVGLDLQQDMFWLAFQDAYTPLLENLLRYTSGTTATTCPYIRFWDYSTGAWGSSTQYALTNAAAYLADKFGRKRFGYTRQYEGLAPVGETQGALFLLRNHDIADEVPYTRHFYATEIARDIEADTVEVKWEEI